jgi:hypothetical protein
MRSAQSIRFQVRRKCSIRGLGILISAVVLASAASTQSAGIYFQNGYGIVEPANNITFSEFSPPPNTFITTQYQLYGVTFSPGVYYASIYNQTSGTPHVDPTACVANFVQFNPPVQEFSILFARPVSAAAFAVLSQPGTFQVRAFWAGIEVPGGPATFTGGYGPQATTNFVGLSGVTFDELRISHIATSDGALVLDNLQFSPAYVNSWTNPHSARWDAVTNWSLYILPASDQTVVINNDGYKAVNIDSTTFASNSASVTINNLLVAAPANALSTLLLNYAGLNAPFRVLDNCFIGINGTIENLSSSFEVDGNAGGQLVVDGGTYSQEGGLAVVDAPVFVRSGSLNSTNGNLTLGNVTLGTAISAGIFNQNGGSIAAQGVRVENGTYTLASGILYAINGTAVTNGGGSVFHQAAGTNFGDISVGGSASYDLDAGRCQGNTVNVSGDALFHQNGGLMQMQSLNISGSSNMFQINPIGFFLRQGEIQCGTLNIGGDGQFEQDGGRFILTNHFDLHGLGPFPAVAYFVLVNGIFSCPSMSVRSNSGLSQRGGSNEISGGLTVDDSTYYLPGGVLETTYSGVGFQGAMWQARGSHYVHGVLSLSGRYDLLGGPLHVDGLYLRGTLNISDSYQPADFINYGLTDLGGSVQAGSSVLFGQVRLSTNAVFNLNSGATRFQCHDSSAVAWTPGVFLVVTNWHVPGPNAVYFGASASSLSASQLRQVIFSNPGGFAPGDYPAQLLSTGELVPAPRPTLQFTHSGSALVFTWPSGFQLFSALIVTGPYTPVPNATSPWTNFFTKPREFFRLQGL